MKRYIARHKQWYKSVVVVMLLSIILTVLSGCSSSTEKSSAANDLVIPIADISETAVFYPVEIDDVNFEVLAVKAPDGSIRTAFNTCQVCYDSGRGYYKQDGKELVCQNCGNRFTMDKVEVESGGCNPFPIFEDNKTVDDKNITISRDFLTEAKGIFLNWKTES
ncbi:MAG: DUF2318 domain-containing protein [Lachnospiraceae bacterium]|nr:DUF2318 domain-containing protein [Lachnospiraceae bacterium]